MPDPDPARGPLTSAAGLRRSLGARGLFLTVAVALLAGAGLLFATAPAPERLPAVGARPTEVDTLEIVAREVRPRARVAGLLEARRSVELFSETRGSVSELGAHELDRVSAGQLLVEIDRVRAELAEKRAEAALARARSDRALRAQTLRRQRSLAERAVASAAALDEARSVYRVADAALREAEAILEETREELRRKQIVAPFAGVLRSFPLEEGEFVQEGQRVGELLDTSSVVLRTGVSDREIVGIEPGRDAEIRIEAFPNTSFRGTVARIGGAVDPTTKKFPVEIDVPNPDGRLLPGMVARAELEIGGPTSLVLIPRDAAIDEYGRHFVYVVEEAPGGLVARRRSVALRQTPFYPTELELVEGLEPGQEIATSGLARLRDGASVIKRGALP